MIGRWNGTSEENWSACEALESRRLLNAAIFLDRVYAVGTNPVAIATADFDRDGIADLATADADGLSSAVGLSVVLGQADGTFAAPRITTLSSKPTAIAAADINRDGNPDLLTTGGGATGALSLRIGDGDGSFAAPIDFAVGANPTTLAVADFNGDTFADVAVANADSGTISVLLGTIGGGLSSAATFAMGANAAFVVSSDLNGDGKPDLAASNGAGGTIFVALGAGDGSFNVPTSFAVQGGAAFYLAAADFNSDDVPDLVTADGRTQTASPSKVIVYFGTGSGAFGASPFTIATPPMVLSVIAGDFTGDGNADVASGFPSAPASGVRVFAGDGAGALSSSNTYATGPLPRALVAGDFNRDGAIDLASGNTGYTFSTTRTLSVLLGAGDGTFIAPNVVSFNAPDRPTSITWGDFNGDDLLDVVASSYGFVGGNGGGHTASVLLGLGDGAFAAPTTFEVGPNPSSITTADFDHDGELDLAISYSGTFSAPDNRIRTFHGNGDGTFTAAPQYITVGTSPANLRAIDINSDGFADLGMVINGNTLTPGNTISFLLGNANGTLTSPPIDTPMGGYTRNFVPVDFNGDDAPDLLTARNNGTRSVAVILTGNGDGTFGQRIDLPTVQSAVEVAAGDVNGDGLFDVVTSNERSVSVLVNQGDGDFAAEVTYAVGETALRPIVVDLDNDGLADIAVSNYTDNSLSFLKGRGDGTFDAAVTFAAGQYPTTIIPSDQNNDGRLDLLVFNTSVPAGGIAVMINQLGPGYVHLSTGTLMIDAPSSGEHVTISESSGQITVASSIGTFYFNAPAVAGISFNGTSGDDTLNLATSISKPLAMLGGSGNDTMNVISGTSTVEFASDQTLAHLNIAIGATVNVAANGGTLVRVGALSISGRLDLNDNDLIATSTLRSTIESYVRTAYNFGDWLGTSGIFSSTAKSNPIGNTTLGLLSGQEFADNNGGTFDGVTPNANDVLVKYTYFGDVDFNGLVDVGDYNLIDFGFANHLTGWAFGDADYSSGVDASDYNVIDFAFATQVGAL